MAAEIGTRMTMTDHGELGAAGTSIGLKWIPFSIKLCEGTRSVILQGAGGQSALELKQALFRCGFEVLLRMVTSERTSIQISME